MMIKIEKGVCKQEIEETALTDFSASKDKVS